MRTTSVKRGLIPMLMAAAALLLCAVPAAAQDPHAGHGPGDGHDHGVPPAAPRNHTWDAEVIDLFENLPVQEGGRIKPLGIHAGWKLLQINGTRTAKTADGTKLGPVEWLLDVLFFPETTTDDPIFVVDNADALTALGVAHDKRRDRLTYEQLEPARNKLMSLASEYSEIESKSRTANQAQILTLAHNVRAYENLAGFLRFAEQPIDVSGSAEVRAAVGGQDHPLVADVLAQGTAVLDLRDRFSETEGGKAEDADLFALSNVLSTLDSANSLSRGLALIPPSGTREHAPEYLSPALLVEGALFRGADQAPQLDLLRSLERMRLSRDDPAAFVEQARMFSGGVTALAESRGEYDKIGLELFYYQGDYVYRSLLAFMGAFLLCGLTWVWPQNRKLWAAAMAVAVGACLYLTLGVTLRCILRERPPVTTLYETILFITAVGAIGLLTVEWMNKKRIAGALAIVLGAAGMFLAHRYEMFDRKDTMPQLIAVLDTNFWLSTHVTTVTIGYAAGLMAGAVGHVYLFANVFGLKRDKPEFYKNLTRMTYGLICFGLLFSVVGTVLGGIWANDSWGRFWGWDPKENGALMIVFWELIILHSRMGGYVRDWGLAMMSVFGMCIVAFSWWHVNVLGVGLHAYGFTGGIKYWLFVFYGVQMVVLAIAAIHWFVRRQVARELTPANGAGPPAPPMPPVPPSA